MKKNILFLIIFFLLFFTEKMFSVNVDSAKISLLTVMPRPEAVYTIYGHTAIRICDKSTGTDMTFNYGTFDTRQPLFIYHFIKGETDYFIDADPYDDFIRIYTQADVTVYEQDLNLTSAEKRMIIDKLYTNLLPWNRNYRYNFFFDNCTTRIRDIVEQSCEGKIIYGNSEKKSTFRTLVHECTNNYPWMAFGIDLLLGSGADSTIDRHSQMFLPVYLMNNFDNAYITAKTGAKLTRTMVLDKRIVVNQTKGKETYPRFWQTPLFEGILVAIVYIVFNVLGFFKDKQFLFLKGLIFFVCGLAGCLLAFVAFFSVHPCTFPNWNLLWLHPLHLYPFATCFFKKTYKLEKIYHYANFSIMSFILLGWTFIPQNLNVACVPFILCLWVTSLRFLRNLIETRPSISI